MLPDKPLLLFLALFIASAVGSCVLGLMTRGLLLSRGIVDRPNARSSHLTPTVRWGGIGIMAVVVFGGIGLTFVSYAGSPGATAADLRLICAVAIALAIVSFIDDIKSVGPGIRFGCHSVAAIAAIVVLSRGLGIGSGKWAFLIRAAAAFLWIAGYTNAFNFMDGINGIAAGQATITGIGSGVLGGIALGQWNQPPILFAFVIAGAAAGCLPHNFPRARMFMGDVGSAPLGFLLAVLTIWLAEKLGWRLLLPLALLHANFVLDTGITLVRRIVRGEKWYEAHREHFYQRLVRSGKSHTFVTCSEMGLQLLVLLMMIGYLNASVPVQIVLAVGVVLIWAAFFWYCEAQFRKSLRREKLRNPVEAADW